MTTRTLRSRTAAVVLASCTLLVAGCSEAEPVEENIAEDLADEQNVTEGLEDEAEEDAGDGVTDDAEGDAEGAAAGEAVPVTTVLGDVAAYTGTELTVAGQVDEVLVDGVLTLVDTEAVEDPLLVVLDDSAGTPDLAAEVSEAADVQVTGTLMESFDASAVAQEGDVAIPAEQVDRFDGQPYLMATTVEVVEPS